MSFATLFYVFAAVASGVLALAGLVALARRGVVWVPAVALATAAGTLATAYFAGSELLGRPKPARLEVVARSVEEATLAGSHYVENEAIYLWLLMPGEDAPRAYAVPWSQEAAEALQSAQAEAEANGTEVVVRRPFQREDPDGEPQFYAAPPPPMPAKVTG